MTQTLHSPIPAPGENLVPLASAAIPYATPAPRKLGLRVCAGAVILAAALGLVLLGGCFVIGVMMTVEHTDPFTGVSSPRPLTGSEISLIVMLNLIAFACFGGAAALLILGTRGLLRVMQGEAAAPVR